MFLVGIMNLLWVRQMLRIVDDFFCQNLPKILILLFFFFQFYGKCCEKLSNSRLRFHGKLEKGMVFK